MNQAKKKMKNRSGFSLAETLIAILIILLVSSVVAAGMPAAQRAYVNVQVSADAQLLLSTTLTELRNELATATDIKLAVAAAVEDEGELQETITDAEASEGQYAGNVISYTNPITGKSTISFSGDNFMIQRYQDISDASIDGTTSRPLVSNAAKTKSLSLDFGDASPFTYAPDDGTVTIAAFSVKTKSDSEVAGLTQSYVINLLVPKE